MQPSPCKFHNIRIFFKKIFRIVYSVHKSVIDEKQYFFVDTAMKVNSDVPQGAPLEPSLFLLDIPDV